MSCRIASLKYFPWKRSDGHCTGDTDCTSFFRKVPPDKDTFLVMDVSWLSCSVFNKNENVCVWEMQRRKAQRRRDCCIVRGMAAGVCCYLFFSLVRKPVRSNCTVWHISSMKTSSWLGLWMFRQPAWAVGSCSSGPPTARSAGSQWEVVTTQNGHPVS